MTRKALLAIFLSTLAMPACKQVSNKNLLTPDIIIKQKQWDLVFEAKKVLPFSSNVAQDTFHLKVTGLDYLRSMVRFTITSHQGRIIYGHRFSSNLLIDNGIMNKVNQPTSLTDSIRSDYIQSRLNTFFDNEYFRRPAVAENATYENGYISRSLFKEFKANPDAVGFFYLIGKEDGRCIAWSNSSKKVSLYYKLLPLKRFLSRSI